MEIGRLFATALALTLATASCYAQQLKIAYNVLVDAEQDDYEIFVMNLDGSDKVNITHERAVDWTYVAGDDEILFISDRDTCYRCYYLYAMTADGEDVTQIGGIRLADSWMDHRKEATEIIVTPHKSVDSALYVIDRSGTVLHRIQTGLATSTDPVFVPGLDKVIFRGSPTTFKRDSGYADELYMVDMNGGGLRQLTKYPASDTTRPWFAYRAGPPRIHPTEGFASFQSYRDGQYRLYGVNTDSGEQSLLIKSEWDMGWHDWSPDGRWLVVELFDTDQTQFHIGLVDWDAKTVQVLTDTSYTYQQAPVFVIGH